MKNLLFVSIAFPPKADAEGLQVAKYLKYLLREGSHQFNFDAVTSKQPTLNMPHDASLGENSNGVRQIIEIPIYENRYTNYLLRKLAPWILNRPDSKYSFYWQANKVIKRLLHKPDIIYSRSFPLSSAMMAYKLKQHYQVPWVMHLSDPWTLNPIHSMKYSKSWNKNAEEKCFKSADLITVTSKKTLANYQKKYPEFKKKVIITPNVFDSENYVDKPYRIKEKITVIYTGGLVENRTPLSFISAFENLKRSHPNIAKDYQIFFAGGLDRRNREFFMQCTQPEIQHIGTLSLQQAIKLQQEADILLLIDTPTKSPKDAQFFPSKLLDYMLLKRRVLALTDTNSTTWEVIQENKLGDAITHTDKESLIQFLINTWREWKKRRISYFSTGEPNEIYSSHVNAKTLCQYFSKLTS